MNVVKVGTACIEFPCWIVLYEYIPDKDQQWSWFRTKDHAYEFAEVNEKSMDEFKTIAVFHCMNDGRR